MARKSFVLLVMGTVIFFVASLSSADVPHMINYQGKLTTASGGCLNDTVQMTFTIYSDSLGTVDEWSETQMEVIVKEGIFNVLLGAVDTIPTAVFDGNIKYLGVKVESDPEMTPLKPMVSVAYAYRSLESDTADYARTGPEVGDNDWIFRITDTADTTLITGGAWGIARYGNELYGNADSTHVNLGVACTTGTSGQNKKYSTVGGGASNSASGSSATVGGGFRNTASGGATTVGGGYSNAASGASATVGGGESNTASGGEYATVAGGWQNTASGNKSTVGGGWQNTAGISAYTTVGGGYNNTASGPAATVGGGEGNTASSNNATVGGGGGNTAGYFGTVGGGRLNTASGYAATVGGGNSNTASGDYSTVSGGYYNTAQGDYSFAAGRRAKANNQGCFVWGDATNADVACNVNNRWVARASGGVYFYTNASLTSGVYVAAGGNSWNSISDRATKENFISVNGEALLKKLNTMPVQEYNLKSQNPSVHHIGPVAQDFYAAFGYGESDKAINMEDAVGVALAGVKELAQQNQELRQIIEELSQRIAELEKAK